MRTRAICIASAAPIACALLALLVPAVARSSASVSGPACGATTQTTVQGVYKTTTWGIYRGELADAEVKQDAAHVLGSAALASALATGDTAGVLAATHALVYHPHWHIVRLRVLSASGQLLADVGGPYVLAPVRGKIRYHGTLAGSYEMSVQDDLGYAKLVARFTGLPVEIYMNGQPVVGQDFPPADVPPSVPAAEAQIAVGGVASMAATYHVSAFPQGSADVLLAVPRVGAGLTLQSCFAVTALTYTSVAKHVARLLKLPAAAATFVNIDHEFDSNKLDVVRQGSVQLAGEQALSGQPLQLHGSVSYGGQEWLVTSFAPVAGIRVYLLFPGGIPAGGATGTSGAS